MAERREAMVAQEGQTIASKEDLAKLRADVESREEEVKRLEAKAKDTEGTKARSFVGEGDRQYLTGLKIGGQRILLAIDTSASMLDDTIVNVIRRRNMSDAAKKDAPKWRRAVRTVEWLAAQFPLDSQFQIYGVQRKRASRWPKAPTVNGSTLRTRRISNAPSKAVKAVDSVRRNESAEPRNRGGRAVAGAGQHLSRHRRSADARQEPANGHASTDTQRVDLFHEATKHFPPKAPINVIMFPLEGDPIASAAYWDLAQSTTGAYLVPSKDWP